jgi:DNA-binding NarL/FixJ family response regulator
MTLVARSRVLCVDDHELLLDGLTARIALEPDIAIVGCLSTADRVVESVRELRADVVLLDIDVPGANPLDRLLDLRDQVPETRVIMLSAHIRDHYIDIALSRGARGYLWKGDAPSVIIDGIRKVLSGRVALSSDVAERLRANANTSGSKGSRLSSLSPREIEVLRLVGKGMSRADIAKSFCRSLKTIDAQHTSIMKKLDIHDRAELTRFAIAEGLVEV